MIKLPVKFEVFAESAPGISSLWKGGHGQTNKLIDCCIPVEFSGPGGAYSSGDLFALSIINGIIGEFKFICEKKKLSFKMINANVRIIVDSDPKKLLKITAIDLYFTVEESSDVEEVKKVLDYAINNCPIINSIQIPKTLHVVVK